MEEGPQVMTCIDSTYHKRLQMDREEETGEHRDTDSTLREGYAPGKVFREDTVIWSYN